MKRFYSQRHTQFVGKAYLLIGGKQHDLNLRSPIVIEHEDGTQTLLGRHVMRYRKRDGRFVVRPSVHVRRKNRTSRIERLARNGQLFTGTITLPLLDLVDGDAFKLWFGDPS